MKSHEGCENISGKNVGVRECLETFCGGAKFLCILQNLAPPVYPVLKKNNP